MVIEQAGRPLALRERPAPDPGPGEVLIQVSACAVCRTDLHILDAELPTVRSPLIPGHEVVGTVVRAGPGCVRLVEGQRVGVPWLGHTCQLCRFCRAGRENLCERAEFTGYHRDGGYAEHLVADERFAIPLPERDVTGSDEHTAPLLCAGLIGYRSLRLAGDARRVGLYGFGASAHIVAQVARHEGREVFAFTRAGDVAAQSLAVRLGATWAGASTERPPVPLDAAIIFAPVGALVPAALAALDRGGVVVAAGIYMSPIPEMPYALLWEERVLRSVANLTRADAESFFGLLAGGLRLETTVHARPLAEANEALSALRSGLVTGAAVLVP